MSHELRTPLAAIYGAAMTLRRRDVALTRGAARASCSASSPSEADRLARIVNDILWASRLDAGTLSVDDRELRPGAARARRWSRPRGAHLPDGITLALDAARRRCPLVAADPDKVRQVLVNLVDNAVKYSPDGGEVELALAAANGACSVRGARRGARHPRRRAARGSSRSSTASTPT